MAPKSNVPIRICGSKTRSGCRTCKNRHVKCDEEKPVCLKCQKRNRECIYDPVEPPTTLPPAEYTRQHGLVVPAVRGDRPYSQAPITGSVSPYGPRGPAEVTAIRYFVSNLGKELAGRFSDEVWCSSFPRIAQHEPAIWNATVAVGMLDMSLRCEGDVLAADRNANIALKHYNQAISELNVRLASLDSASCRDVVLLSCLLFAVFECMQNNTGLALKHISGGTKLLMEWTHDAQAGENDGGTYLDRQSLLPVFFSLDSQAVQLRVVEFIDFTSLPAINERFTTPESFSTIDEAHLALSSTFNRMGRWACWLEPVAASGKKPTAMWMDMEQRKLHERLVGWDRAFESMPQSLRDQAGGVLLLTQRMVMQIFWNVSLAGPTQVVYDQSMALFQKAIEYAETYMELAARTDPSANSRRVFTTSMDIVMGLFVLAAKCRNANLRRRALAMLKSCNRKEGVWDSGMCTVVAERVVELEEAGALPDGFIPESARVYEMDLSVNEEGTAQITYKRRVLDENGQLVDDAVVDTL